MSKLWGYEDYVKHLAHSNRLVRLRALDALTIKYPLLNGREYFSGGKMEGKPKEKRQATYFVQ